MITAADQRASALIGELFDVKVGVEIGVFTGALSERLLARSPVFLFMVDPWAEVKSDAYKETDDFHTTMTPEQHENAMAQAMKACMPYRNRCEIIRATSEEAAGKFHDGRLDFVFIDGDHSYKGCKQDIDLWFPKLKPGGLLSGHDYRTDMNFGVIQAVHEFMEQQGMSNDRLRLGENYTWFITK